MAKTSKKTETKPETKPKAAAKAPPAKVEKPAASAAAKVEPKKVAAKTESKPRPNLLGGGSMIDTNLAASAAASFLVARRKGRDQMDSNVNIDQIKSDLAKPASAVAGDMLDQHAESTGGHRPNLPNAGPAAAARNQTVGNAAARTSVPRRTAG